MKLGRINESNFSVITLNENRLDAVIAPKFKKNMEKIIDDGHKRIILDINKLSFMDSSSLGVLVSVLKYLGGDGKMVIAGASGIVLELFKLTRMDKIFTLTNDVNAAKNLFTKEAF